MPRSKMVLSEYRSYELPPDFPVLVLDGDEWRISPQRSVNLHFHNCVEIGFCRSGQGMMLLNQEEISFQAEDVTLIGADVHHTTWSTPADSFSMWSYVFVDLEKLLEKNTEQRSLLRSVHHSGCLILHQEKAPWAPALLREIIREMREQKEGYRDCVRGMLLTLFTRMVRTLPDRPAAMAAQPSENPLLLPALSWMHENYAADFSMEKLASLCHLSPTHFRRLFKEQLGTTPLDYLHQIRIYRSCSMLLETDENIASVAGQVGYSSLSCFNRHFLRFMGVIPSQWRKTADALPRRSRLTYTGWTRAETSEEILRKAP